MDCNDRQQRKNFNRRSFVFLNTSSLTGELANQPLNINTKLSTDPQNDDWNAELQNNERVDLTNESNTQILCNQSNVSNKM